MKSPHVAKYPRKPKPASDPDGDPPDARMPVLVQEYLKDLDLHLAGIRAGYTSRKRVEEAFADRWVQVRVLAAAEARAKRLEISTDHVLQELARIAFSNPTLVMDWDEHGVRLKPSSTLSEDVKAIVSEVSQERSRFGLTMKIKFHDKIKALEMLGRHLKLWHNTSVLLGPDGRPLDFEQMSRAEMLARIDELNEKRGA